MDKGQGWGDCEGENKGWVQGYWKSDGEGKGEGWGES